MQEGDEVSPPTRDATSVSRSWPSVRAALLPPWSFKRVPSLCEGMRRQAWSSVRDTQRGLMTEDLTRGVTMRHARHEFLFSGLVWFAHWS